MTSKFRPPSDFGHRVERSKPFVESFHTNLPLQDFTLLALQDPENFVSGKIPMVGADARSGLYWIYDEADWNRQSLQVRASGTEAPEDGWAQTTDTYVMTNYGGKVPLDMDDIADEDDMLDSEQSAVTWLSEKAKLRMEKSLSALMAASVWTGDQTGVASGPSTDQFLRFNATGAVPSATVNALQVTLNGRCRRRGNTIIVAEDVDEALRANLDVKDQIKYTENASRKFITDQKMADYFGVQNYWVMRASENTADEGQTAVYTPFMTNKLWLGYVNPNPSKRSVTALARFKWDRMPGGTDGVRTRTYMADSRKSEIVETDIIYVFKKVAARCGVMFLQCLRTTD